jgi:co-chaperonin GroES (HSP10)
MRSMKKQLEKLFHDWVLVGLDPIGRDNFTAGGVLLSEPKMVRTGTVLKTGPGKFYTDKVYKPIDIKVGEHVAFFAGNMDTKQGKEIRSFIEDDEALLPEPAILFAFELEDGEALPRIEK